MSCRCSSITDTDTDTDTDPGLEDGFEASLTNFIGCADVALHAYTPDGSILLSFGYNGLVLQAYKTGAESLTESITLPGDVWVEVSTGVNQHLVPCNDAIHGGIETHRTYTPLSGSATLTVTPTDKTWTEWEMPADATVVLENVEFEDDSGDTVTLPTLTITHYVGWLPG